MKKIVVMAAAIAALTLSCSKKESTTESTTDTTKTTTPPTSNGAAGKLETSNGNIKVTGGKTFEYEVAFEKANYLLTVKSKSMSIALNNWASSYWSNQLSGVSATANADGYYVYSTISQSTDTDKYKYQVVSDQDYIIEYQKLPLTTAAATLPTKYTGSGFNTYGPFTAKGTAQFVINCADAQKAGFVVELFNEKGENVTDPETYTNAIYNNYKAGAFTNTINETVSKTNLPEGKYFIEVNANGSANYTIDVK